MAPLVAEAFTSPELQALMALLGHSSAEMSLRYGRLFDQTVRADYERGLTLAKERLRPVLPVAPTRPPDGDWRELPVIKSRLAEATAYGPLPKASAPTPTSASTALTFAQSPECSTSCQLNGPTLSSSPTTRNGAAGQTKSRDMRRSSGGSTPSSAR